MTTTAQEEVCAISISCQWLHRKYITNKADRRRRRFLRVRMKSSSGWYKPGPKSGLGWLEWWTEDRVRVGKDYLCVCVTAHVTFILLDAEMPVSVVFLTFPYHILRRLLKHPFLVEAWSDVFKFPNVWISPSNSRVYPHPSPKAKTILAVRYCTNRFSLPCFKGNENWTARKAVLISSTSTSYSSLVPFLWS